MKREEMLKFCSVCKNRKMDLKRGLVCSLTDDYADFDPVCENYAQDTEEKQCKLVESEANKRLATKGILLVSTWGVILVAAFFILVSCFLIPTWPALIYIILGINGLAIASIVAWNVLCWKQVEKERNEGEELTIDKIMECVRKEGYYPQKCEEDDFITFKIQGKPLFAYYDANTQYFKIVVRYSIDDDQKTAVEEAAFYTMKRMKLIKICTYKAEEKICMDFSIQGFISSISDFESFFPNYMTILLDSIDCHEVYFSNFSEEQVDGEAPRPKIGFPTSSSNIKS